MKIANQQLTIDLSNPWQAVRGKLHYNVGRVLWIDVQAIFAPLRERSDILPDRGKLTLLKHVGVPIRCEFVQTLVAVQPEPSRRRSPAHDTPA